jgi:hypothetical protein
VVAGRGCRFKLAVFPFAFMTAGNITNRQEEIMRTVSNVIALILVATSTQALSATPVATSVTGPPPIAVDVHVINDESTPVPVYGDISSSVSGAVDVTSLPTSLTDQLDTLIEEVRKLASPAQELIHDATVFHLTAGERRDLAIPEGVVLTDIVLDSSTNGDCVVLVDNEDQPLQALFHIPVPVGGVLESDTKSLHLQSGIRSDGTLVVGVWLNDLGDVRCSGNLFWSGYKL